MPKITLIDDDPKQKDFELKNGDIMYNIKQRQEIFKILLLSKSEAVLLEMNTNTMINMTQREHITYMGVVNRLDDRYSTKMLWVHIPQDKYEETITVKDRF